MEDLRVPKRKAAAEVVLAGGDRRRVSIFLAEAAHDHDGPELPRDLVSGPAGFLPVVDEASGAVSFLNLRAVLVLRVSRELDAEDDAFDLPVEHPVELWLDDGSRLQGVVSYVRPDERSRLVDMLNEPSSFVRLIEPDALALVNKRHIARVSLSR